MSVRASQPRGFTIVYGTIVLFVMLAFVSLSVDWGRVQTAKSELADATDAAARYAATGLSNSTALAKAQTAAAENKVDGVALALTAADVEEGIWDAVNRTFTVSSTNKNAVRVTGRRSASRGTAISLDFARIIGKQSVDLKAVAVASITTGTSPDIVGLSSVTLSGSGIIKRAASESGSVNVASNGSFSLSWGQQIAGNVLYRGSPPSTPNGSNCITGSSTLMSSDVAYATPTTPGGCMPLGAANFGNGQTYNLVGGNYSATSVTLGGGATVNLTGNVNVYCSGAIDIGNGVNLNTNNGAYKLTLYQTAASTVSLNVGTVYARIYAPLSNVSVTGSTSLIGSVICKNLVVNGSGVLSYSSALPSPVAPTGGGAGNGAISLVK